MKLNKHTSLRDDDTPIAITILSAILIILVIVLCLAVSFFATAGLIWVVCWALGFVWSWKLCIGIWALMILASSVFKSTTKNE